MKRTAAYSVLLVLCTSLSAYAIGESVHTTDPATAIKDGTVASRRATVDALGNLSVNVSQNVRVSAGNSSTDNIAGGATFTGVGDSTLGVAGIQVILKTDQNCHVYVEQSTDNVYWDVSDEFDYEYALNNFGVTVQAVGSYARVRVTNTSSIATTYFRLSTALCPVVSAVPRSLNDRGNFKVKLYGMEDEYGFDAENTPNGELRTVIPTLLVGRAFEGTVIDNNFWTTTVTDNGTVSQANAQIVLSTGTVANATTKLLSVRRARYVPGQAMVARFQLQVGDNGVVNNVRRWGVAWGASLPTITDGAYFELDNTTLSIVTMRGGTVTKVASGSFNNGLGAQYTLDNTIRTYEIYWNNKTVFFTVGGEVLHRVDATNTTWAATMQHHIYLENSNSGGLNTDHTLVCRIAGIRRLGQLLSQPSSKYQAGQTAGVVLKYGTGNLHGIAVSGVVVNSVITLYDNTAASGTILWSSGSMSANSTPFFIDFKGIPYFTGLTLAITGANSNAMVAYE